MRMVLAKQDKRGSRQSFGVIYALSKGVQKKNIAPDRIVLAVQFRIVWTKDDGVSVLEHPA